MAMADGTELSGPPKPPDYKAAVWDQTSGFIESILLASVHMWTGSHGKKEVLNLIVRHFVPADVFEVNCVLSLSVGADKPGGRRDTPERAACDAYALDLYDKVVNLVAANKMPKVVVSSLALPMVPRAELKTSDEISVSARLESLEKGLQNVTAALGKLSAVQPVVPAVKVTAPSTGTGQGSQNEQQTGPATRQPLTGGLGQPLAGQGQWPQLGLGRHQAGLGQPRPGLGQSQAGLGQPQAGLGQPQAGL